jgi:hypothetical protein
VKLPRDNSRRLIGEAQRARLYAGTDW